MVRTPFALIPALLLATALAPAAAAPGSPSPVANDEAATRGNAATAPATAAMRAFRDPETGALVQEPVTPEQQRMVEQWNRAIDKSGAGLVVLSSPNGTQMVDLQGRYQHVMRAARDDAGSIALSCSDGPARPDLRGVVAARRAAAAAVEARDVR
jgi:hypothetical protein